MKSKTCSSAIFAFLFAGAVGLSFAACTSDNGNDNTGGKGGSSTGGSSGGSTGGRTGGSTATGGSSGGSTGSPNSGTEVTFSKGQAKGAMSGYGWIALGKDDSVTSPTCGTDPITNAAPCTKETTWAKEDSLCVSGSIPALPASPVQADYDNNWGIQIGVNGTADATTGPIGLSFSSITLKVSGSPTSGLRAVAHKQGDPAGTTYCFDGVKTGVAMDITKFNTTCWDNKGTSLTAADSAKLDKIGLQVSSSSTAITVSSLCLEGMTLK